MKSLRPVLNLIWIAFALLAFTGCEASDDKETQTGPRLLDVSKLSFSLTRGVPATDANAVNGEWMYDWSFVVVDDRGKIEAMFSRDNFTDKQPGSQLPVEQEIVDMKNYAGIEDVTIYEGTKTVYVFANMEIPSPFLNVGGYISNTEAMQLTATVSGNGFDPSGGRIPMSNIVQVTLTNEVNQPVSLPVIRMFSKIEFTFNTFTYTTIEIQQITMNHINLNGGDNIYLFGRTDDFGRPLLPASATDGSMTHDVSDKDLSVSIGNEKKHTIYINESAMPYPETLGFTLITKRADSKNTEIRYALTIAEGLKRNDFLKVPVKLTDYEFNPRIDFFPPIGGYADVEVSSDPSEVFYVKVNSGGQFILRPQIYDASLNIPVSDDDENLTIEKTVISGENILSQELSYNVLDGWYDATIDGTKSGRILYTLTYRITDKEHYGTSVILQRKIYVIKE